jgi:hypothetical protein
MKRIAWSVGGLLLVAGLALGVYLATPRPTQLTGDAWDYTILANEVPDGWRLVSHSIITAHDVAQESLETSVPITASASLANLHSLYYADYRPQASSEYFDFTIQTLLYVSAADAASAMAREDPGPEWESVSGPSLGEESRIWHFINPEPDLDQNIYRVDFRYLNGIGSLTMMGTAKALPDFEEPVRYARKMLDKMRAAATPQALRQLERARLPDLRQLLLSQDQLAQLDPYLGGRWQLDSRSIPQWTPNESFAGEEARALLRRLGRVTGYQVYLVKALSSDERDRSFPASLFQQVSAYSQPEGAHTGLSAMAGVEQLAEVRSALVDVGDEVRLWTGLLPTARDDGTEVTVAVHEIDFRVGPYVGSIRLQTRPLDPSEYIEGRERSLDFARELALALAANLSGAGQE